MKLAFIGIHVHAGDVNPAAPASGYLHTFKHIRGVQVVAYCVDPHSPWGKADAARLAALQQVETQAAFYESVDDLLARQDFDAALILMPPSEIPAIAVKLARAKKQILCEKQFAKSAAEFAPVLEATRANGVQFFGQYPWRLNPVAVEMRRLIEAGAIGRLLSIEIRMITSQIGVRDPNQWLYRRETQGGGMLHMLGGHFLDMARALMGGEVKRVAALCRAPLGKIQDGLEEAAVLALEWENGAVGSLHCGYLLPRGAAADNAVVIRGEDGVLAWSPGAAPKERLFVYCQRSAAPERTIEFTFKKVPLVYAESQHSLDFIQAGVDALRENRRPPVAAEDCYQVLRIIDAAYESSRTGRQVEL